MATGHDELAARLRNAYRGGAILPLRDGLDPADGASAYAVQRINTDHWRHKGRRVVGRKIGLTSTAVQAQLGVDQPDFGTLFHDMQITEGSEIDLSAFIQPRAEAEVALVLGQDIEASQPGPAEIAAAVDHAVCAIEIVDSRIADWRISFADTVADNGSAAAFVLGRERRPLEGLDLWSCGMVLEVNGAVASVGAGAACLGHPLEAAAWLAAKLAAEGEPLRAGDVVLTGALGPMVPLTRGDGVRATIGGLGRGGFSCSR